MNEFIVDSGRNVILTSPDGKQMKVHYIKSMPIKEIR